MSNSVKIQFSVGLLIVFILHSLVFAAVLMLLHPSNGVQAQPVVHSKPTYEPSISAIPLPAVNEAARDEIKQGIFGRRIVVDNCPTCPQPARPVPAKPTPAPVPVAGPSNGPARLGEHDTPSQQSTRYEITLFLDGSPKSQQLQEWFKSNPTLVQWRSDCSYQEYTPDSPLYKTMTNRQGQHLSEVVPPGQFPAVVFCNPDGGHIHAAGGNMLPSSAEQLIADVQKANELSKQMTAQNGGLLRTSGYRWDADVTPAMKLESNCPDNNCPVPTEESDKWRPGKVIHDVFGQPAKNGFVQEALWGWLEILVAGVVTLVLGFMLFIVLLLIIWKVK